MSEYGNIYEMLGSKVVRKFSVGDYVPPVEPEEGEEMIVNAIYSEDGGAYSVTLDKTFGEIKNAVNSGKPIYVFYNTDVAISEEEEGKKYQIVPVNMVTDYFYNIDSDEYMKAVYLAYYLNLPGFDNKDHDVNYLACASDSDYPSISGGGLL